MKVYVVHLNKKMGKKWVEEIIGVRRSPEKANKLLDGRDGGFCEYDTNE